MKAVTMREAVEEMNKSMDEIVAFRKKLTGTTLGDEFELIGRRIDKRIQKLLYAHFLETQQLG